MKIPKAERANGGNRITPPDKEKKEKNKVVFSFEGLERNEYFNLEGTCNNWASDLFIMMQEVSAISIKEITAGEYTGKQSKFRIHNHKEVKNPCAIPKNVKLEDMCQIRLGRSKGAIHGVLSENIFYVIWLDPLHNLYPDEKHGLRKVKPASTCCKDRDEEINELIDENERLKQDLKAAEELMNNI